MPLLYGITSIISIILNVATKFKNARVILHNCALNSLVTQKEIKILLIKIIKQISILTVLPNHGK